MNKHKLLLGAGLLCAPLWTPHALADADEDLAKKLANPIAALISLPFQYNYDSDIGPANGHKSTLGADQRKRQPIVQDGKQPMQLSFGLRY